MSRGRPQKPETAIIWLRKHHYTPNMSAIQKRLRGEDVKLNDSDTMLYTIITAGDLPPPGRDKVCVLRVIYTSLASIYRILLIGCEFTGPRRRGAYGGISHQWHPSRRGRDPIVRAV